ncbi:MAG TPA: hypothetical protein VGN12_06920 [Pirellulales bacterium]|jgi:hypothetical protein
MTTVNDLKLEEHVYRYLFASPAEFRGECFGHGFYLTVAFPSWGKRNASNRNGDGSRFVFSIRTEPPAKDGIVVETYVWAGEEVSALLGAFYGKLIFNLGQIQAGRIQTVPTTPSKRLDDTARAPFNSEPRKPNGPLINLFEAQLLIERYISGQGEERLARILQAAKFYRIALESIQTRPEIALAMFCATLETLLPLRVYSEDELYDKSLAAILKRIAEGYPGGERIVRGLKSRLYQIKRKVVALVNQYLPDSYFDQRETSLSWAVVKSRAELLSRIKNTYDLRSRILHTGDRNGLWYLENDRQGAEIGAGSPVLENKKLEKVLAGAMTLTGVERVTSTVLRAVITEWLGSPPERPLAVSFAD